MRWIWDKRVQGAILVAAVLLLPLQQVLAANPALAGTDGSTARGLVDTVRDVALQPGGEFRGQVVDAQGAPAESTLVKLVRVDTGKACPGKTDAQGRFVFRDVTAGVYRVETPVGAAMYRIWGPGAAPPSAAQSVLVIQGDPAVRGNMGSIGPLGWTLIGLGIAAAIAVPLAMDDDDDAS